MKNNSFLALLLIFIFSICLAAGTSEEYRNILEGYDKENPAASIGPLKNFINENSGFKAAYLQLFSWCRVSGDYSSLADFQASREPSGVFLSGVHSFMEGKKDEGVAMMMDAVLNNGDEIDDILGFHLCDFLEALADDKPVQQLGNNISNRKQASAAHFTAVARLYYDKGEFRQAAEVLAEGIKKHPKSFILRALNVNYYYELSQYVRPASPEDEIKNLEGSAAESSLNLAIMNYLEGLSFSRNGKTREAMKSLSDGEALIEKFGFVTFKPELQLLKVKNLKVLQEYKQALQYLNTIKSYLDKIGVPQYLFSLNLYLGDIYTLAGKYEEAFQFYTAASKNISHDGNRMFFHQSLSSFYLMMRKYEDSMKEAQKGLEIAEKAENNTFKIAYYIQIANLQNELGNLEEALANTEKAIKIIENETNKTYLAPSLASKANTFQAMGRYADARNTYLEALKISEKLSTPISSAKIIGSLGTLCVRTSDLKKAKEYLSKAVVIFKNNNDKYNLAITIGNLGEAYLKGGEYYKALKSFQEAIRLAQELRDIRSTALYYTGMGAVYLKLGNKERSLAIHSEAEKIYRELQSKHYLGEFYANFAGVYYDFDDFKTAELYDKKAIDLFTELNEPWSLFQVYSNLFVTSWARNDLKKMNSAFQSIKKLSLEMKDPFVTAECNLLDGVLLNKKGKSIQARQKLLEALEVQKNYNQNAAWVNYELGISYKIEKDYEKALNYFEEALKIIEKERQALRLSGEATGFLARNRSYYDEYIETLYLYYTDKRKTSIKDDLFSIIEKIKERNFADSLIESHASLERHISKELRDKELNILGKISRYNTEVNYAETEEQLQNALQHRNGAEQELEELKLEIRSKNPAYAKLVYPESAGTNQLKKLVNAQGTTLVSYFIQGKYLYTFCLTNRDIQVWRTEDAGNVNRQTKLLLDLMKTPDPSKAGNLKATASSLYRKLLLPVQNAGELGKQLIIIPDEILYYLPFEVLIKPNGKYVVEEHNIIYGPSATSLMLLNPPKKAFKNEFFAMANPAATQPDNPDDPDSELLSTERGFDTITMKTPLPYTEDEVKNISSLFDAGSCKSFIGKDAKEEVVKNTDLTEYRFLHFATHGVFDEDNPYRSGLLLSIDDDPQEDGLLQYREIYNLKTESELVVLSACKTGMGKVVKGDGLIGISRGFLVSGAGSVVVSLWNVSDVSTAFMMSEFYKNIIVRKMPKSEALRQAKITLIRMKTGAVSSERGVAGITAGRKTTQAAGFSHPYFWGAFIIIGGAE